MEQPSLHQFPMIFYSPAVIHLNGSDTVTETVYWRRNFIDQFLETWSDSRIYPASRIFGFSQDSVWFRSTPHYDYHIFVPMIYKGPISLYYTRYIQNLGEIRMISSDPQNRDYHNSMIVTGNVPRRYANEYTYFVTFPWDTLTMIPVSRKTIRNFAQTYLRVYPEAYRLAVSYDRSKLNRILSYTLIPVAAGCAATYLAIKGNPTLFVGIGAGALITYLSLKLTMKPAELDPEAMSGIIDKCR